LVAAWLTAFGSARAAPQILDLRTWDYDGLYGGLSAGTMIGSADVYDSDGDAVGEVEDFVMGPDGHLRKLIIEAGGFLDFGDTHFAYPFSKASLEAPDRVTVALDQSELAGYSLFADTDGEPARRRNRRLSELIGDYAHVAQGIRYGRVSDVILSREGNILAVVVYPDIAYGVHGPYAWPFYGYEFGFDPEKPYYALPHSLDEVQSLELFTYSPEAQPSQ
jgi:sporulation protein YlmC with PRC-barrel domain